MIMCTTPPVVINGLEYTGRLKGTTIKLYDLSYDQYATLAKLFEDRVTILINSNGPVVITKIEMRFYNYQPGIAVTLEYRILLTESKP